MDRSSCAAGRCSSVTEVSSAQALNASINGTFDVHALADAEAIARHRRLAAILEAPIPLDEIGPYDHPCAQQPRSRKRQCTLTRDWGREIRVSGSFLRVFLVPANPLLPVPGETSRQRHGDLFLDVWEAGPPGNQRRFTFILEPLLGLCGERAEDWMRAGRSRWKIENETFNTLKNQGYHFEHNYGRGRQNLSVVLALLMMLAFLVDQTQQLCCPQFAAAWGTCISKRALWERVREIFHQFQVVSMQEIYEVVLSIRKPPAKVFWDS